MDMTTTAINVALTLALSCLLCGCGGEETPRSERRLVVEGEIGSDGYPRLFLTMSAAADAAGGAVADNIVRWGVVTVSDGENEVILTGGPRPGMVPPVMYYSFDMLGEPGRTCHMPA